MLQLDKINLKNIEIGEKQQEIDNRRFELAATEELFKERMKYMYVNHTTGTLSTLLAANSFSEFLSIADSMRRVAEADTNLMIEIEEIRVSLVAEEEVLAAQLIDLENEKAQLELQKADYASQLQTANDNLDKIAADQAAQQIEYQKAYAEYQAAKEEYEKAIAEASANSDTPYVGGEYLWPVPNYYHISSYYGWRNLWGKQDYHDGIDIATGSNSERIHGKPIVAANDGEVVKTVYTDSGTGFGIYAMIDHGGGQISIYGHCSSLAVQIGQQVKRGETIAYVGDTGRSSGAHLHFEVRINNQSIDPEPLLRSE